MLELGGGGVTKGMWPHNNHITSHRQLAVLIKYRMIGVSFDLPPLHLPLNPKYIPTHILSTKN